MPSYSTGLRCSNVRKSLQIHPSFARKPVVENGALSAPQLSLLFVQQVAHTTIQRRCNALERIEFRAEAVSLQVAELASGHTCCLGRLVLAQAYLDPPALDLCSNLHQSNYRPDVIPRLGENRDFLEFIEMLDFEPVGGAPA